ncbi:hypothetical protein B484DRAFT_443709 [Ochromonadaceae sp. CCMP2298]|nr:hypothetical protein B484DRAFT_443709 [Ochromonadaceae sp. CCMP2298]|mmetsp:Transcript_30402/g.67236  ORF Transcript_30402/g.67236 Transcript_30402/m.67236 type:complete len:445 (+) Transcript_30402:188-1522(+)
MEHPERIFAISSFVATGASLYQSARLSNVTQSEEQSRHEKELELLRGQHRSELVTAKQTYLISTFTDIEQYCQELNENLINSTKDAERDMVDQRSQQFQTILVAGTIMITSVLNILIQGQLPVQADKFSIVMFSVTNAGSVVFISLNMLLCIQLIYRITQFMYRRSEANLQHLSEAMSETKAMMGNIRGDEMEGIGRFGVSGKGDSKEEEMEQEAEDGAMETIFEEKDDGDDGMPIGEEKKSQSLKNAQPGLSGPVGGPQGAVRRKKSNRSRLSALNKDEIDVQWGNHEAEVHEYLHRRSAINERRELMSFGVVSFEKFWNNSCKEAGFAALICFYIGTSLMLLATMIFYWNMFLHVYFNRVGAYCSVATVGVSLFVCLGFAIYLRFFDPAIRSLKNQEPQEGIARIDSFVFNASSDSYPELSERSMRAHANFQSAATGKGKAI